MMNAVEAGAVGWVGCAGRCGCVGGGGKIKRTFANITSWSTLPEGKRCIRASTPAVSHLARTQIHRCTTQWRWSATTPSVQAAGGKHRGLRHMPWGGLPSPPRVAAQLANQTGHALDVEEHAADDLRQLVQLHRGGLDGVVRAGLLLNQPEQTHPAHTHTHTTTTTLTPTTTCRSTHAWGSL